MKMSSNDLLRYSKQIILKQVGISGQKKIFSTKVLIVGMGGLGCPVALYLSNLGIKKIGIADHDKVDFSNLNRQILFNTKDIGKLKAVQAKRKLQKIDRNIKINIYKKECNANNICRVQLTESKIKDELLRSILSKAARLEKTDKIKK